MAQEHHPLSDVAPRWAAFADGLGLSDRPLRDRLTGEYASTLLPVVKPTIRHLPDELGGRLQALHDRLTAVPNDKIGSIAASIEVMDDEEVRDIARALLEIGHVVGAYDDRVYE